ncbi:hypothetical protein HPB48_005480 [Haemaphysalis longicornis]|uniref:Transposable element P transposase-like RNase H domain-containing protein n=1 Tax=Haemaphysalis longicornis TaxID=44386 RepID=A0A9J6H3F6_HAELO|nr:hypothetical protein HPB48_005480 [Haemaphysalis longicornis]
MVVLVFDELKLSENINVKASGELIGFVDLGPFTDDRNKTEAKKWIQILGVFASKGNVKASVLSKILVEATILAEKAGLFVDYWTIDGAPWNRALWKLFGIKATSKRITRKVSHPVEPGWNVHFISDFSHLIKCIRNAFVSTGLHIPDGHTHVDVDVREAWKKDSESVTLKVMPHITQSHV